MKWRVIFTDGVFVADALSASTTELIAVTSDSQYRIRVIPIASVTSITPYTPE